MRTARRRTSRAVALSALAHLGLLVAVVLQRSAVLTAPPEADTGPPRAIIPVLLMPRALRAGAGPTGPAPIHLHRRPARADDHASSVAPLPAAVAARPSQEAPQFPAAGNGPPAPDLRAALRHGVIGCANAGATLTRAERTRCNEQLGRDIASAPFMPAAIDPRVRAYYDAVVEAKTREPALVPPVNREPIPGDPPPQRRGADHIPGIGCSIPFGPGRKPRKLPHALYLGPCFIEPPKGPFDPEIDLTPP